MTAFDGRSVPVVSTGAGSSSKRRQRRRATVFPFRVLYNRRLPGIVLPFTLAVDQRVSKSMATVDPGKDRPAIALVPNGPRQGSLAGVSTLRQHRIPDLQRLPSPSGAAFARPCPPAEVERLSELHRQGSGMMDDNVYDALVDLRAAIMQQKETQDTTNDLLRALIGTLQETAQAVADLQEVVQSRK
ncbi:hypothetical protein [Bradyrhizobium sp. CCBAU 53338]|uniref:hypothetical protein n=1 Tax=Bradyrhizobium sp. CCBAU 53338 TaxID=1325111 RepID=UPI00188CF0CB|nr:hypothetical protein [Bradyrhizobium sp. CCBAU 53338]